MNDFCLQFERGIRLSPDRTSVLLGFTPQKWARLRSDEIELKKQHVYSMVAHKLIKDASIDTILNKRAKKPMNSRVGFLLHTFETFVDLSPTKSAEFLGIPYPRYNEIKNETLRLQLYVLFSIQTHYLIDFDDLEKLKEERT